MEEYEARGESKKPANLPQVKGAHLGQAKDKLAERIAEQGARTIPPREHGILYIELMLNLGGNCDIKNLSRGSKTFMPVYLEGGKFSIGDLHFSQGDGEICMIFIFLSD